MAHHNNTPESVLKAPRPTVRYLVQHTGTSRRERRHTRLTNSLGLGRDLFIPKHRQAPATNTPYVASRPQK
jgi:hypothetical protein